MPEKDERADELLGERDGESAADIEQQFVRAAQGDVADAVHDGDGEERQEDDVDAAELIVQPGDPGCAEVPSGDGSERRRAADEENEADHQRGDAEIKGDAEQAEDERWQGQRHQKRAGNHDDERQRAVEAEEKGDRRRRDERRRGRPDDHRLGEAGGQRQPRDDPSGDDRRDEQAPADDESDAAGAADMSEDLRPVDADHRRRGEHEDEGGQKGAQPCGKARQRQTDENAAGHEAGGTAAEKAEQALDDFHLPRCGTLSPRGRRRGPARSVRRVRGRLRGKNACGDASSLRQCPLTLTLLSTCRRAREGRGDASRRGRRHGPSSIALSGALSR